MERNANDTFGTTGDQGANTGSTGSFGGTSGTTGTTGTTGGIGGSVGGAGMEGSTGFGTSGNTGGMGTGESSGGTGRLEQAKNTVQDKFGQVKEKSRNLQASLADKLDAGADKLRQRSQNAPYAAVGTGDATAGVSDERAAQVQDSVARGLSKSADWLRNGDLQQDIERQVRDNPGRTLLIALGVGYLLGKAFRGNR